MTSMLPTLEDLHKKARLSQVIHPNQYVSLDTRLYPQTPGQTLANEDQRIPPVTVTQEQDEHRRPGLLRDCTTVFGCGRFKTDYPSYRPIHRQMSNSHAASSEHFVCWRDWPRIRQTCFLLTFICLAAIIFCAVISVYTSNHISNSHSSQRKDLWWYRDATFYEIFPASFQDTDADSYGDFQGIIRRLDYIRDLGMTAIRLNSIFSALDYPLEYEHIIDLHSADPHLGRMDEFRLLVDEAHHRGLKVVLDINPTITSDQHTWALHWQRGIPGYEHFYASANRSKSPPEMENSEGPPPEEWELTQRTFGGHYVLNWSNPFVQKEYQKTIAYWLDTGVDGFYMKHLEKIHVVDFHHIANIMHQWRTVLDSPPSIWNIGRSAARRILIVSSKFAETIITELGQPAKDILKYVDMLDYPILVGSGKEMAQQVSALKEVSGWPKDHPTPMWHLGSSDTFRLASRIEYRYNMAAFYLLMTLTGSRSVFYGDEIGLRDSYDVLSGRVYRGGQLTPMQWTADNSSGGFTDNMTNPWLPLNPDHYSTNVQNQQDRLNEFRNLTAFRWTLLRDFRHGIQRLDVLEPNIIVLERKHRREYGRRVVLVANFGSSHEDREFPEAYGDVSAILATRGQTQCRIGKRNFSVSPGAAFITDVRLISKPTHKFIL
ncbi:alpha-glucosidase-like [Uloborus diversus]|uniref:alpha-glucosidase-like n=1 Tax=Uloborus diversus TaxID=327109 RepID=UPI00240A1231|nr:alpha-glucosidase-like [Uloborus diversus]